jgi:hypothetical protein
MTATTEKFGSIGGFASLLDDNHIFEGMREQDYPQFVTKTIRLLGSNSGLHLRFAKRAEESCFNPKTKVVTIPAPPAFPKGRSKSEKEKFKTELARWRGILNHEVGHAQYTLWRVNAKDKKINSGKKTYPASHHMFNDLFENGRMERVACEEYPGMMRDLQKLGPFLGEIVQSIHDEDPAQFNHIYYALRMVVNGYEPVIAIPEDMREDWDKVRTMAEEAWHTNDEEETYQVAQKVAEYLKKRYEEEKEKADKEKSEEEKLEEQLEALENLQDALDSGEDMSGSGSGSCKMPWEEGDDDSDSIEIEVDMDDGCGEAEGENGEEEGDPQSDAGESKGENSGKEDCDDSSDDSKDSEDEEDSEEEKEDGTPEKAERGTGKGSREKVEAKEDSEEGDSEEESEKKAEEDAKKERAEELKKEIEEKKKEIAEKIKEQMKQQAKSDSMDVDKAKPIDVTEKYEESHTDDRRSFGYDSPVIPLPLHDYVKNIDIQAPAHSTRTKKVLDECISSVSGMAQRFIQKVRSRVHVGTRTFKGRVNRRKLHRYKYDKNIFKTQSLRKKKDAAVMIIVDCSGSMSGKKIQTARKAALVIGEMMSRGGVEFEIRGFTVPFHNEYSFPCFTREADLIHYRFGGSKDWNHTKHCVIEGDFGEHGLQDNDDGESLRHFADELSQSKKDSKMMIVISDGEPCARAQIGDGDEDLKQVIPEIRNSGIDVYAIGLSTNVQKYYGPDKSVDLKADASTQELVEAIAQFVNLITVHG